MLVRFSIGLHSAFDEDTPEDVDYRQHVFDAAYLGSISAFEDLRVLVSERTGSARWILAHQTCGIGANFFFEW